MALRVGTHFDTSGPTLPSTPRITTLAFVVYGPLTVGALAWAWLGAERFAWTLETPWLNAPYTERLALSLGLGLALALTVVGVTPVLVERTRWARALHAQLEEVIAPLSYAEITWLALASGFAEELFFRGAMQPVLGLVATSVIFGAVHVGPKPVLLYWTTWAFVMGVVLGLLFELTGVLWGPVLAHVWINQRNMTFIRRR